MRLEIRDKHTGEYPNLWSIARRCKWAKHLIYCDMDGFALDEEGRLLLMDECGNTAYCPPNRFEVSIVHEPKKVKNVKSVFKIPFAMELNGFCPKCNEMLAYTKHKKFCGFCGQAVKWSKGEQP